MNLVLNCNAYNVVSRNEPVDPFTLLTDFEKKRYIRKRCTDKEKKIKLDSFKYLDTTCTKCCNEYLKIVEEGGELEDELIKDYTYPSRKKVDTEEFYDMVIFRQDNAEECLKERLIMGDYKVKSGVFDVR